jgi:hypothetical protein
MDPEAYRALKNIWYMLEVHDLTVHILQTGLRTADRFFFEATGTMQAALTHSVARGEFAETRGNGGPHNMVYSLYSGNWGKMRSWRSLTKPSLQVTLSELRTAQRRWVGDADIDLGNPVMDVVGFFTHLIELVVPGKTSHRKLEGTVAKIHDDWLARQEENA